MAISAGQLRHRVAFYKQSTTRSATGAVRVGAWEKVFEVWGQFVHLSVKDVITGQSAGVAITARAIIRHRTDITHTMRVGYDGRLYDIVGEPLADNASGREYLTLMLRGVDGAN